MFATVQTYNDDFHTYDYFYSYDYINMKIVSQRAEAFSWLLKCTAKLLFKMTVTMPVVLCQHTNFSAVFVALGFIILKCYLNSVSICGTSFMT